MECSLFSTLPCYSAAHFLSCAVHIGKVYFTSVVAKKTLAMQHTEYHKNWSSILTTIFDHQVWLVNLDLEIQKLNAAVAAETATTNSPALVEESDLSVLSINHFVDDFARCLPRWYWYQEYSEFTWVANYKPTFPSCSASISQADWETRFP